MTIKSRLNKLESKLQPVGGRVITKQCIDAARQTMEQITGEARPVSYVGMGKPLVSLSVETRRLIDELTGRNKLGMQ